MTAPKPAPRFTPVAAREFTAFERAAGNTVEGAMSRLCQDLDGLRRQLGADEDELIQALRTQGFGRVAQDYCDWLDASEEATAR